MNSEGLGGPVSLSPFAWSARGSLAVLMVSMGVEGKPPGRPDWWAVRADAPPRNLTAGIVAESMQMSSVLVAEPSGTLIGVVGNNYWRLDPDGGAPTKLSPKADQREVRLRMAARQPCNQSTRRLRSAGRCSDLQPVRPHKQ